LFEAFANIFKIPELKKRILFTLGMLAIFRIGSHIPTPGIDGAQLAQFISDLISRNQGGSQLLGFVDMFSGGSLSKLTIFALGIMPYISASIILQLLTVVIPWLQKLSKEGELGRRKITQYTRYGTIVISLIQSSAIALGIEKMEGGRFVANPGIGFILMTILTLTSGTAFLMWLGERITERGIGNGISMIIFAGIVASMPSAINQVVVRFLINDKNPFFLVALLAVMVAIVALIVFVERGQRRVPVQYAKRVVGRKVYGGQNTYLPLKLNTSGVIPPIFASSLLAFPAVLISFFPSPITQRIAGALSPSTIYYNILYVGFIIFFCYFYTAIVFNPIDLADNMKKYGGFIPGVRPGRWTAEYIDRILSRITFAGAAYVSFVCVLPSIFIYKMNVPFYFGGTSLLIVIGVALDTASQIESHLLTRHYEGFLKKGRMRGRRG
jgi:preprotein translocase subunit SecY